MIKMFNEFTKFKIFKFKCDNKGKTIWIHARKKIRNKKGYFTYFNAINKKYPILVSYMSVGYFLNPNLTRCKKHRLPSSKTLANTFLWSDFLVDIDHKDINNLKKAISTLKKIGFKKISAYKTPHGFQIWCMDFKKFIKKNEDNIGNREKIYLKNMEKIANLLKKEKVVFDYGVSIDTRRIARTPLHLSQIKESEI